MYSSLLALVLALLVTAALTPLVRRAALRWGAVDEPGARRVHTRRVPRLGGVAIIAGFFAPLAALAAARTHLARALLAAPRGIVALATGALLVAAIGLWDDLRAVGARRKLAVQLVAAAIAYAGGLRIDAVALPFVGTLYLGAFALPVTMLWIAGVVNALNLIDGLDGLAAGVAFLACATNFVVAYVGGHLPICLLSAALAGAILGFLLHNFNPATIFMGDAGSLFLGFVLATASLQGAASQKSPTLIALLVPLTALGLPILDMLFAMARRVLERRPIFAPDRGHIHHRLLDLGLTHRRAVLVLYAASLAFTAVALAVHLGRSWQVGGALLGLTALVVVAMRVVWRLDVAALRPRRSSLDPVADGLRRVVPRALPRLAAAGGADDVYRLLAALAADAGLARLEVVPTPGAQPRPWRWAPRDDHAGARREEATTWFRVRDARGATTELHFAWDSAVRAPSPQAEILLRLVADAVEDALQRTSSIPVPSSSTQTRRLRPIA